ncbi:hypothetical protein RFI_14115, partial [Reticulomyxa filosa]
DLQANDQVKKVQEKKEIKEEKDLQANDQVKKVQEKETASEIRLTSLKSEPETSVNVSQQSHNTVWEKVQDSLFVFCFVLFSPKYLKTDALQMFANYEELRQLSQQIATEKEQVKTGQSNSTREIERFYEQLANQLQEWKRQARLYVEKTYDKSMEDLGSSIQKLHSTIAKINGSYSQALQQHVNGEPFEALTTIRTGLFSKKKKIFKQGKTKRKGRKKGNNDFIFIIQNK